MFVITTWNIGCSWRVAHYTRRYVFRSCVITHRTVSSLVVISPVPQLSSIEEASGTLYHGTSSTTVTSWTSSWRRVTSSSPSSEHSERRVVRRRRAAGDVVTAWLKLEAEWSSVAAEGRRCCRTSESSTSSSLSVPPSGWSSSKSDRTRLQYAAGPCGSWWWSTSPVDFQESSESPPITSSGIRCLCDELASWDWTATDGRKTWRWAETGPRLSQDTLCSCVERTTSDDDDEATVQRPRFLPPLMVSNCSHS